MEVTKGWSEQDGARIDGLDKASGMEKAGKERRGEAICRKHGERREREKWEEGEISVSSIE